MKIDFPIKDSHAYDSHADSYLPHYWALHGRGHEDAKKCIERLSNKEGEYDINSSIYSEESNTTYPLFLSLAWDRIKKENRMYSFFGKYRGISFEMSTYEKIALLKTFNRNGVHLNAPHNGVDIFHYDSDEMRYAINHHFPGALMPKYEVCVLSNGIGVDSYKTNYTPVIQENGRVKIKCMDGMIVDIWAHNIIKEINHEKPST
jgi:hypothetical protein